MKDYLFLFRGGMDFRTATPEQMQNATLKWRAWLDEIAATGRYGGGERLTPESRLVETDGGPTVDGPYAEAKEVIGGYIVVKAADFDEAVAMTKGCPIFIYGGTTEVREISKMN